MNKYMLSLELIKIHPALTHEEARNIVDMFFSELSQSLINSKRIEIRGFGSLSIRLRSARSARNPKTNAVVKVKDRRYVYFRAGKELLMRVNKKNSSHAA